MSGQTTIDRECSICGTIYPARVIRLKWGRETTCSRSCSYELRRRERERKVWLICSVCGTKYSRTPAQIKSKHGGNFCSPACHYAGRATGATKRIVTKPYVISEGAYEAWRIGAAKTVAKRRITDNYRHTDATRSKLSIATARALTKSQGLFGASKLEMIAAVELTALGIAFHRQHPFRDALARYAVVVDFWLTDKAIALEVNGTWWHADPRLYTAPLHPMQARCLARYNRKLELLKTLSVRVVEVWELDLKRDPRQAVLEAYAQATAS